jgi:hypothetical protein
MPARTSALALLAPTLLLMTGCPTPPEATVFWTDVAPIVEQHCVSCHQTDGVGPFRLDTYEEAAVWAGVSAQVVAERAMPPYLVRDDGTCGDFEDGHWLTDAEITTLQTWAAEGAQEGDGATVTVPATPVLSGTALDTATPDFTPQIVGGEDAEFDEYRCFAVELGTTADAFLTGYEVLPGNEAIVHHVIGMPVDLDAASWANGRTNREQIELLRGPQPERDGWPCFNGAGDDVSFDFEVVAWAPGQGPVEYPDGVGLKVPAGTVMVYQVHYNLVNPATLGQSDQTTVRLRLEDDVDREAYMSLPDLFLGGAASTDSIPPGQAEASVSFEMPVSWLTGNLPFDFEILGILPHMHERGRRMSVSLAHDDGASTCVADVQRWNFAWQRIYMYETPITFDSSDTLVVECIYDTTGDDEPTTAGWGTQNEMCLPGLLVTLAL